MSIIDQMVEKLDEWGASRLEVAVRHGGDSWTVTTVRESGILDDCHPDHPGITVETREVSL